MVLLNKIKNKLRINYRKKRWPGLIEAYKQYLPVTKKTPIISLNEGNTPLILSESISNLIGNGTKVFLKYDGLNPTGSFKDRGMTMAISKAKEEGREAVICASTGNTSAAAAAYASRGGLKPYVLIPEGFVAQGKLAQALMYGAEIISINGNFDKALEIVRDLSEEHPIELVNSVNPYRIQGQKTAAFEIVDDLGHAPDWLCIPMGNAGNITAYWMGFKEYSKIKRNLKLPIMMGFQSEGSAPLVKNIIVKDPETIATAIRIGNPVNREKAKKVRKESKGDFQSVTDEEIINAYKILAKEGVFCEPASAASVAGLIKNKNRIQKESNIVCVLTGNGLKDPDCAIKNNDAIFRKNIEPSLKNITKILGY
jgi:threonine synthase